MAAFFITGTGTDVGKTYVTAALLRALVAAGVAVDALKPVVSGFDLSAPQGSDPAVLLEAMGEAVTPDTLTRLSPWQFTRPLSPPLAARLEGRALQADAVISLCRGRVAAAEERLLAVEGAGGVMSPLDDDTTMLDLAAALELPVLLVAGSYLGTISHTLTAVLALRSRGLADPMVVVSETPDAPELGETLEAMRRLLPGVAVSVVMRGGGVDEGVVGWAMGLG